MTKLLVTIGLVILVLTFWHQAQTLIYKLPQFLTYFCYVIFCGFQPVAQSSLCLLLQFCTCYSPMTSNFIEML